MCSNTGIESVVGFQLSVIGCRLSVVGCRLSVVGCRLSVVGFVSMDESVSQSLPALPARPSDGHKGTFGTVCVIGGQAASPNLMIGGPALSAIAALRVGCGLARLAMPEPVLRAGLTIAPEATGVALPVDANHALRPSDVAEIIDAHMRGTSCIAIGPGLGHDVPQQQIVVRLAAQDETPMVIDADALNALAELPAFDQDVRALAVLTPHPGEFDRLAQRLNLHDLDATGDGRPAAATSLAQRLGCVVVLKGARTVISDGVRTEVNMTGNAALATAGSGDVLTGVIAGLIAQFHRRPIGAGSRQVDASQQGGLDLFECARIGVHVHGAAADLWAASHDCTSHPAGMIAGDLLTLLPDALAQVNRV